MNTTTLGMESSNFIEVSPKLSNYDFDGHDTLSSIAENIAHDMKWEENMKRQALNKTDYRKAGIN